MQAGRDPRMSASAEYERVPYRGECGRDKDEKKEDDGTGLK